MAIVCWHSFKDVSAYNRRLETALVEAAALALRAHPELIGVWLFGSRARGNPGPRADVDLLLVAGDAAPRMMDRPLDYRDLLDAIPAPVDLLVLTPAELARSRDQPFYRRVIAEAKMLGGRTGAGSLVGSVDSETGAPGD
jgi:predicted nucleotidyltransferase